MALTQEQREKLRQAGQQSRRETTAFTSYDDLIQQSKTKDQISESEGVLDRIKGSLSERFSGISETFRETARGEISPLETGVRTVGDVIGGVTDVIMDVADPVVRPVIEKVAETKLGGAAFEKLGQGMEAFQEWKGESEGNRRLGETIEGLVNIADIIPFGAGARVGKRAAREGIEAVTDIGVKTTREVTERAIPKVGEIGEYAVTQLTGMQPDTIRRIVTDPDSITRAQLDNLGRIDLAQKVKTALDKRLDDLASTGTEYRTIRLRPEKVNLPAGGYKNILVDKFKLEIDDVGRLSRTPASQPMKKADLNAIQEFYDLFGTKETFTVDEFLNARKQLDNIAKFEAGKTDASSVVAKSLRKFHDLQGKKQIPGLAELDKKFSPEVKKLNRIKKDLLTREGELKDTAISQIANITGKGKEQKLTRLQDLIPNIAEDANLLKALEDIEYAKGITVGAYMRGGLGAIGVGTGNIPALLGAIAATPDIMIPLLQRFGKATKGITIEGLISKMKLGKKLTKIEKSIIKDALENAAAVLTGAGVIAVKEEIEEQVK